VRRCGHRPARPADPACSIAPRTVAQQLARLAVADHSPARRRSRWRSRARPAPGLRHGAIWPPPGATLARLQQLLGRVDTAITARYLAALDAAAAPRDPWAPRR